jgi:type III secretory pathway component EscS
MYYNVTLRRVRVTIVAVEKQQALHIMCACVRAVLVIQHEKLVCHIKLLSVACLGCATFSLLSHKRHDFLEKSY